MNFNSVVIVGKVLTLAQPFIDDEQNPGLKVDVDVVDRYYTDMAQRNKHLTSLTILIYKKTIRDFVLRLNLGDIALFSCKLGNVAYEKMPQESKLGLIIAPYWGEVILLEKSRPN